MKEDISDFIRVENQASDVLLEDELLGEISDEELGFTTSPERAKNKSRRYCVRVSFVLTADAGQEIGTQFEDYEKEAGFAPVWLELAEAMRLQIEAEKSYGDGTSNGSYNGRFANRRDYLLLRKYDEIK